MMHSTTPQRFLTQAEFFAFEKKRLRMIYGFVAIFLVACLLGVNDKLLHVDLHVGLVMFCVVPLMLWTLVQTLKFKCPRCGATPLTTRKSVSIDQVEVGNYVAFRPKVCQRCGVSLLLPLATS